MKMNHSIVILIVIVLFLQCSTCSQPGRSATSGHSDPTLPVVSSFLAGGQYVLLTFSNGPHSELTPKFLDILSNYSVHATFFVFGQKGLINKDLLQRMVKEGHEIGQQGFYPKIMRIPHIEPSWLGRTVNVTTRQLAEVINKEVRYFRSLGPNNLDIGKMVHSVTGMRSISWSIDVTDKLGRLRSQYGKPQEIVDYIMAKAVPGSIILAYDTHPLWLEILPLLLQSLIAGGFECLTVSEMMSFPDDAPH
ncbi:hypothetical protein EON65_44660 [archaeon]|nr:MAG: hypothetical protein EON65_44660 [archaeon]